jgi:hypothetical protein
LRAVAAELAEALRRLASRHVSWPHGKPATSDRGGGQRTSTFMMGKSCAASEWRADRGQRRRAQVERRHTPLDSCLHVRTQVERLTGTTHLGPHDVCDTEGVPGVEARAGWVVRCWECQRPGCRSTQSRLGVNCAAIGSPLHPLLAFTASVTRRGAGLGSFPAALGRHRGNGQSRQVHPPKTPNPPHQTTGSAPTSGLSY